MSKAQPCFAVQTDGSLWAGGLNDGGQVGNGTTNNASTPVRIGSATDWRSVAAGSEPSAARKLDGSLWAWGKGNWLGDGSFTDRRVPTRIGTAQDWRIIAAGTTVRPSRNKLAEGFAFLARASLFAILEATLRRPPIEQGAVAAIFLEHLFKFLAYGLTGLPGGPGQ